MSDQSDPLDPSDPSDLSDPSDPSDPRSLTQWDDVNSNANDSDPIRLTISSCHKLGNIFPPSTSFFHFRVVVEV